MAVTRTLQTGLMARTLSLDGYRIHVREPGGAASTHLVSDRLVRIGTHPSNDLVLSDPTVSGLHAELRHEGGRLRLVDVGSRNGCVVNALRVVDAWLPPHAVVLLGGSTLEIEPSGAPTELPLHPGRTFGGASAGSDVMRELFGRLTRAAGSDATVLLEGESGTGKELLARGVHAASARASGPFVVVDCSAIPANLVESELFGHERGAFTGALGRAAGLLERAHGGTVFLDEIGELPLDLQPKLLRALAEKCIRRVGGLETVPVDVRVVAATHRDLRAMVQRGTFRLDLYYRLAVVRAEVPPLRARSEDVPLLLERFAHELADPARAGRLIAAIDDARWERLMSYAWPGNVRELRNVVERALALSEPPDVDASASVAVPRIGAIAVDLDSPFTPQKDALVSEFERAYTMGQLDRAGGNVAEAARRAGMERKHFHRVLTRRRDGEP